VIEPLRSLAEWFFDRDQSSADPRNRRDFQGLLPDGSIPPRSGQLNRRGAVLVDAERALRHSAVWACVRLRADLVSTFPVKQMRDTNIDNVAVQMPLSPILVEPGGAEWDYLDWMWASNSDLDRSGNTIGLITEVNALGLPSRIDLQPTKVCSVVKPKGSPSWLYRIDGKIYTRDKVWHERQYPVSGFPLGLSPVAYAAWSIGEFLSLQDFALDWFGGGAVPKAAMRNKAKKLQTKEIVDAKQWYRDSISNGDVMIFGADWEYDLIQAAEMGMEWLDGRKFGIAEISRFFGCPSDLIDAAVSGQSVTYANISQRNLQFLIMNLQPLVTRRERRLSKWLPRPRYVQLDTDALLRMDPQTRALVAKMRIDSRTLTPSEARGWENQLPLTQAQIDEFNTLFPPKTAVSPPERLSSEPPDQFRHALDEWLADAAPRSPAVTR
jgi:HK97 family phage portal protein